MSLNIKSAAIFTALLLSWACEQEAGKKPQSNVIAPPARSVPQSPEAPSEPPGRKCVSIEALEILADGNTVASRLGPSSWVAWRADTGKAMATGLPVNYVSASPEGKYLLANISRSRFHLLELENGRYRHNSAFSLRSSEEPSIKFTADSRHLLIRHTPYYSRETQLDFYRIEDGKFLSTYRASSLAFFAMDASAKSFYVGVDKGYDKRIAKYDLETFTEIFRVKLPLLRSFNFMEVSKDRIIARLGRTFHVYDVHDGELLYQKSYDHVYEVDFESNLALVAKGWENVAVVDLMDGTELFEGTPTPEAVVSSCRLLTNPLRALCRQKSDAKNILEWGMESGENKTLCY